MALIQMGSTEEATAGLIVCSNPRRVMHITVVVCHSVCYHYSVLLAR